MSTVVEALQHGVALQAIVDAAIDSLVDELVLAPKPGLVCPDDRGSHADMDFGTMQASIVALRPGFEAIVAAAADGACFDRLRRIGIEAEHAMRLATGGINTHRGAIFMLGLLCAAAGAAGSGGEPAVPAVIRSTLLNRWGTDLSARALRPSSLPGGIAARRLGLRSASQEAALGFPTLFDTALPALLAGQARRLTPQQARLDSLFHVIAVLDDSNLAHRGGLAGLRFAQRAARDFLRAGGTARIGGLDAVEAICAGFARRRLSPGGAADTLAAACWLQRIDALSRVA
jgi:triphosphoribosyl-dephospho-CoA synthase